jgi:hypothetical protein
MAQLTANEQLTAESAMTQSGDIAGAVTSSQVYTTGAPIEESSAVLDSSEAADITADHQADLENMAAPAETTTEPEAAPESAMNAPSDYEQWAMSSPYAEGTDQFDTWAASNPFEDAQAVTEATSAAQAELDSYTAAINSPLDGLPEELAQDVALIEDTMNRRIAEMEVLNKNLLGAQTKIGIRAGRQRYAAEIQTSILGAEEAAGLTRITDLEREKLQLIREAEQANSAKEWELLDKKMSAVLETSRLQEEAIQNAATLALQQEQLALQKSQEAREEAKYLDGLSQKEAFFSGSDMVNIMKELPVGITQEITDPGTGVTYTLEGLATDDPNLKQYSFTDDAGDSYMVTTDLSAGGAATSVEYLGNIGKSKTAAASTTVIMNQATTAGLDAAWSALEVTKGEDGFYNTDEVVRQYQKYVIEQHGDANSFINLVIPSSNPEDSEIQAIISGKLPEAPTTYNAFGIEYDEHGQEITP